MILTESILELIPKDDKRILILKYKDDRSIKEIAEIMNKTESAIKMQLMRAKLKVNEI
jgi:RNA polymerase sigma factor (sigma-70 family)